MLDFSDDLIEIALSVPASGNIGFHVVLEIDSVSSEYAAIFGLDGAQDFQIDANHPSQFDWRLNPALSGGPFSGTLIVSAVFDRTGSCEAEVYGSNALRAAMTYGAPISSAVTLLMMTNRSKNA